MARQFIGLELLTQLNAIHHRHHYRADDQIGNFLEGQIQTCLPIHCFDQPKLQFQMFDNMRL